VAKEITPYTPVGHIDSWLIDQLQRQVTELLEQVETLTSERDAALLAAAEQREQLDAAEAVLASHNRDFVMTELEQQIATLSAERDEARALVQALGDQAERFRRERDEARAKD
jgi:uncharacterized coiled-coil DUF342 family protein